MRKKIIFNKQFYNAGYLYGERNLYFIPYKIINLRLIIDLNLKT